MPRLLLILALVAAPLGAQTNGSARSTAEAYGARLDARGVPADLNSRRVNNRVDTRLNNRLNLRIERYRVGNSTDPTTTFRAGTDDPAQRSTPGPVAAPQADLPPN